MTNNNNNNIKIIKIHSTCIKKIEAQQAKVCNNYKNTRLKLLKTNAAIWFNKICNKIIKMHGTCTKIIVVMCIDLTQLFIKILTK